MFVKIRKCTVLVRLNNIMKLKVQKKEYPIKTPTIDVHFGVFAVF